jgi:hypothetical protein
MSRYDPIGAIPPETQILLRCARTRMDAANAADLRELLAGAIDWPFLLDAAHHHSMTQLLYRHLDEGFAAMVPAEILDELRRRFQHTARFSLVMTGELLTILRALEKEGVEAIPYKGPVLGSEIYGNIALRPFADLDLLVRAADVWRAVDVLIATGYRSPVPLGDDLREGRLPAEGQLLFERPELHSVVELHWEVAQRYFAPQLDYEAIRERLTFVGIGGEAVRAMSPEDTFLVLAVHNTKHRWERLIWICDAAEFVRAHPSFDWIHLIDRAGRLGVERMVLLGLHLTHRLLGAPLPEPARMLIEQDGAVADLSDEVVNELTGRRDRLSDIDERASFHLRSWKRSRSRGRYWLVRIFVPTLEDRSSLRLPPRLFFLYYIARPFRLLFKHGRAALGRTDR